MKVKVFEIKGENLNDLLNNLLGVLNEVKCDNPSKKKKKKEVKILGEKKPTKAEKEAVNIKAARVEVLKAIANRRGWGIDDVNKWLGNLDKHYPMAVANICLYELSRMLDHKYEGTINNCDNVYIISSLDGKIYKVAVKKIKSFKHFAAFRTLEDAIFARKVVSIRKLFKNGHKK